MLNFLLLFCPGGWGWGRARIIFVINTVLIRIATECQAKISEAIKIWGDFFFKSSKLDRQGRTEGNGSSCRARGSKTQTVKVPVLPEVTPRFSIILVTVSMSWGKI